MDHKTTEMRLTNELFLFSCFEIGGRGRRAKEETCGICAVVCSSSDRSFAKWREEEEAWRRRERDEEEGMDGFSSPVQPRRRRHPLRECANVGLQVGLELS